MTSRSERSNAKPDLSSSNRVIDLLGSIFAKMAAVGLLLTAVWLTTQLKVPPETDPMTPSSKFSSHLRHPSTPRICKSKPPLPPPPPPNGELPERTCSMAPEEFTVTVEESVEMEFTACCDDLEHGQDVEVTTSAGGGELNESFQIGNCDPFEVEEYTAGDEPGDYTIEANFAWWDGGSCQQNSIVHVVEENDQEE